MVDVGSVRSSGMATGHSAGRTVVVGAGQLGPIERDHPREAVVERLLALLREGSERGCDLVVFPELALTTFFPRWFEEDVASFDHFYESAMPGPATLPLFDEAKRLGIGFCLGYAELTDPDSSGDRHRYNTQILVERDGAIVRVDPTGPLIVRVGASDLAVEAAVAGTGIVHLFEDWLRPRLDGGALEPVLEPWWQDFPGPFLYYPGRRHLPAPLRAFVDFVGAQASRARTAG